MQVDCDIFENPVKKSYTDKTGALRVLTTTEYDQSGKTKKVLDNESDLCYTHTYDGNGNITQIEETNTITNQSATTTFTYDDSQVLRSKTYGAVGQTYVPVYEKKHMTEYEYPDHAMVGVTLSGKYTDKTSRDELQRVTLEELALGTQSAADFMTGYQYLCTEYNGTVYETNMVSRMTNSVRRTPELFDQTKLDYTYDKAGNIETVKKNGTLVAKYYYDGLNRLTREDNYELGKTYLWTYDLGGNITSKKEYFVTSASTPTGTYTGSDYTYAATGWKDRLLSYKGEQCVYDAIGNPTTYRNHNLEWTKVRRLAKYDNETFEYNAAGIRTKKNNITYTLDGNKILKQTDGATTLTFYYGVGGVIGFNYNGADYYYQKNLQGDVIALYNANRTLVAKYVYDAWGNHKVYADEACQQEISLTMEAFIGNINPFRYRSYYYDFETNLYYLETRYYDPETGRFINADSIEYLDPETIQGANLYAYCGNNPVNMFDPIGNWPKWLKNIGNGIVNFFSAIFSSIEAEVGIGFGIGFDAGNHVTAEASRDTYIGIDDGMLTIGNVITLEASLLDSKVGFGDTYNYLSEKGGQKVASSANPLDGPFAMINYPDTVRGNQFAVGPFTISNSGDVLLSFGSSMHFLFGGHASIAFNLSEFFERLFD